MEQRKLQEMGGGTLLVSLPKDWSRRHKLHKGSSVTIGVRADDSLTILTDVHGEPRQIVIQYQPETIDQLVNEIVGAYLLGYDTIMIRGNERVRYEDREQIKQAIRQLVGLEIVEEESSSILAQCLLEPKTVKPEKIFTRMHLMVRGMYRDGITALSERDKHLARIVIERDDEVDRLYFLLVRLIRSIAIDPRLSEGLNVSYIDCLDYRVAANILESIGDTAVEIARMAVSISGQVVNSSLKTVLIEIRSSLEIMQNYSVRAFLDKNRADAQAVVGIYSTITEKCKKLEKIAMAGPKTSLVELQTTIANLNKISRYNIDIADLAVPMYPMIR